MEKESQVNFKSYMQTLLKIIYATNKWKQIITVTSLSVLNYAFSYVTVSFYPERGVWGMASYLLSVCSASQGNNSVTRMKLKGKGQHFQLEYSYRKQIVNKAREYFTWTKTVLYHNKTNLCVVLFTDIILSTRNPQKYIFNMSGYKTVRQRLFQKFNC